MQRTLGGDRLGSGKKIKVDLHGYERSTHDMGYLWRSTMSAGTLVPFMNEVALPGDTFDISLDTNIMTHPTVGPLFGSYKVQLDVFTAPIRLYQGQLHNNKLGIGMNMAAIKLPIIELLASPLDINNIPPDTDPDNYQINPSALLAYLGIRGVGGNQTEGNITRTFNAIPLLAYWDIYKNYYANKNETQGSTGAYGAMIYTAPLSLVQTIDTVKVDGVLIPPTNVPITKDIYVEIHYTGASPIAWQIMMITSNGTLSLDSVATLIDDSAGVQLYRWEWHRTGNVQVSNWRYIDPTEIPQRPVGVTQFQLKWIDDMREQILVNANNPAPLSVNAVCTVGDPYSNILEWVGGNSPYLNSQTGLAIKTYQSDMLNNWLSTEWIDGVNGINEITKVSTVGDSFTIDELQLSKKVYDMLNRIAVSGGSYDDWLDTVYTEERFSKPETPIYHGGLIKELAFQEVVSNAMSEPTNGQAQPLGTLAGRGTLTQKHKGGKVTIKVDEPCYIMGIISLTPRVDYSQGNKWDIHLQTMDDFHKPALDGIGFQELITEKMAWWDTNWDGDSSTWKQNSAGKQPAWLDYMSNVNQVRGNFAVADNEMFMTLNRRYEYNAGAIGDLTTYIDPVKYNHIFADTAIDAQNFWAQISVDITARRKMSAKVMPNL